MTITPQSYFSIGELGGVEVPKQALATVRGSTRRLGPDINSAVPYFASLSAKILNFKINAISHTTTFSSDSFATAIADINASAGATVAYDNDGCLEIRSSLSGPNGRVEILDTGTANSIFGFDTKFKTLLSQGGEVPSAPHGRRGNNWGSAVPLVNEDFTTESITRALTRIGTNTDVLHADIRREQPELVPVAFTASVDGKALTINSLTQRVHTSGLTNASTKEDLAPYFVLIDNTTKQPHPSKVVAVVRGTVSGEPPYSSATTWSGAGSSGNVLGTTIAKQAGLIIESITDGRFIKLASALSVTDFAAVGDIARIFGSTNLDELDNFQGTWIIDEIIDTNRLSVRPMASSQYGETGIAAAQERRQPINYLSGKISGAQSFGTLSIYAGTAVDNGVSLIVRPPLPAGADVTLWVAAPSDGRYQKGWVSKKSNTAMASAITTDVDHLPNGFLTRPTLASTTAYMGK
jgi:hypothetical protein